jgi:hypothetical protein
MSIYCVQYKTMQEKQAEIADQLFICKESYLINNQKVKIKGNKIDKYT